MAGDPKVDENNRVRQPFEASFRVSKSGGLGSDSVMEVLGAVGDGTADDSGAIQEALDAARDRGGGEVYLKGGTYAIRKNLFIYSNTRFRMAHDAVILRDADINNMIISGEKNVDRYEGGQHIEIIGGTWDGNARRHPVPFTAISFGHARYITVRDTSVLDIYQYHAIEFNAVKHGRIIGCRFKGYSGTRYSEAVQLDLAKGEAQFPWYGNYDNTPCRDILIAHCLFEDWSRGIGSHSATKGVYHEQIRIIGCHFENLSGQGIRGYNYRDTVIEGNTFHTCRIGIEMRNAEATPCGDYTIRGNTIRNVTDSELGAGIWLNGSPEAAVTDSIVADNVIDTTKKEGIWLQYAPDNHVVNNIIQHTGSAGIRLSDHSHRCQVAHNRCRKGASAGIWIQGSSDGLIHSNRCDDNAGSGRAQILLSEGSHRNSLQGNVCRSGDTHGIAVEGDCKNNWVTNNHLAESKGLRDDGQGTATAAGNRLTYANGGNESSGTDTRGRHNRGGPVS